MVAIRTSYFSENTGNLREISPPQEDFSSIVFLGDSLCTGFGLGTSFLGSLPNLSFSSLVPSLWKPTVPVQHLCRLMATVEDFLSDDKQSLSLPISEHMEDTLHPGAKPLFFIELGGNEVMESAGTMQMRLNGTADAVFAKAHNLKFLWEKEEGVRKEYKDLITELMDPFVADLGMSYAEIKKTFPEKEDYENFVNTKLSAIKEKIAKEHGLGRYKALGLAQKTFPFKPQYTQLVSGLEALYPDAQFVLLSVPHRIGKKRVFDIEVARLYNQTLKDIASQDSHVRFVDLEPFIASLANGDYLWRGASYSMPDILQDDGIHPNKTGHEMLSDYIYGQLINVF